MKTVLMAKVLKNTFMTEEICEMIILAPEIAEESKAGQFVDLYTGKGEFLLPRPVSICEIDKKEGTLKLLYQVVGKGTKIFSELQENDMIKVVGPLGNGFTIIPNTCGAHVVIGGGIGAPPLIQLVKELQGKVYVFLGFRNNPILVKEFEALGAEVRVATDDGSVGFHGNVIDLIRKINPHTDKIYACGPPIMLKYAALWAAEKNIAAQVSMEERMACGIGACVGCAVKIKRQGEIDWSNLKVCKDGPVFLSNEVVWNE